MSSVVVKEKDISDTVLPVRSTQTGEECLWKECCPYLGFEPASEIFKERDLLRQRIDELMEKMGRGAEEITKLRQQIVTLEKEKEYLLKELKEIRQKPFKKKPKSDEKEEQTEEAPKRKGSPLGHRGATRQKPPHIDQYVYVPPPQNCPLCHRELKPIAEEAERMERHIQEDLIIRKITTCYLHGHGYCLDCKKVFSAKGQGELSKAYIGPVARALAAYLHYEAKISKDGVAKTFQEFLDLPLTPSSIVGFDRNLYEKGLPLYEQIKEKVRWSPFIHADETGWNLDGLGQWLWCFTNPQVALYHIDPKRSSEVVKKFLGEKYHGILTSDDFSAYGRRIEAKAKQKCNVHFLGDIKDILKQDLDSESKSFLKEVKGLIKNAIQRHREYRSGEKSVEELSEIKEKVFDDLIKLCSVELRNETAEKLRKRILRIGEQLFTFLSYPEIDPDNNRAERQLRPNVILRKITFGHRSVQGTKNHSLAMSLIETAKLNGTTPRDLLLSLFTNGVTENTSQLLFGLPVPGRSGRSGNEPRAP